MFAGPIQKYKNKKAGAEKYMKISKQEIYKYKNKKAGKCMKLSKKEIWVYHNERAECSQVLYGNKYGNMQQPISLLIICLRYPLLKEIIRNV